MYPFNLDDFFNLCNRMLVKLPDQVLAIPETLNNILNLAIAVLYLPQKEAFESITRFLVTFLSLNDHPVAKQYIMDEFGKKLLYSVIDTTTTHVPSYFIPDLADIVWCFKEREEEVFRIVVLFFSFFSLSDYSVSNKLCITQLKNYLIKYKKTDIA